MLSKHSTLSHTSIIPQHLYYYYKLVMVCSRAFYVTATLYFGSKDKPCFCLASFLLKLCNSSANLEQTSYKVDRDMLLQYYAFNCRLLTLWWLHVLAVQCTKFEFNNQIREYNKTAISKGKQWVKVMLNISYNDFFLEVYKGI